VDEQQHELDPLDRPIWGADGIAKAIKRPLKQTYGLLANGHLPASRCGKTYVSTLRRLQKVWTGDAA